MLVPCFSVVTLTGAQMVFATISRHKRNVKLALLTLFPLWTPLLVLTTTTTIINLMQCGKHRAKLMTFSAKCCAFHHPSHPALQVCGAQWVGPSEVSRNKWVESRFLWADHHWKHISVSSAMYVENYLFTLLPSAYSYWIVWETQPMEDIFLFICDVVFYKRWWHFGREMSSCWHRERQRLQCSITILFRTLKQLHHSDKTKEVEVSDSSNIQKTEAQAYCK